MLRGSDWNMNLSAVCHLCGGIFSLEDMSFPPEPVEVKPRRGESFNRVWSDSLSFRHKYCLDETCLYCSRCISRIAEELNR